MNLDDNECIKIQSALAESEARFRQMADMTGEWLWEQDAQGYYSYCSNAVRQILGYSPEELIGKHYTQLLTTKDQLNQQSYADTQHAFYGLTNHYRHKDGHLVQTESTGLPIRDQLGRLIKWRGVDRDISARKAAEKQMRAAEVKLAVAQHEIHIAQKIQASLLPALPITNTHFVVTGLCLPADQIGGDYFDYFFSGDDCLDLVIADVSGHSIGPALFMVEARSVIRTQATRLLSASQMLALLNNFLYADLNHADYFITLFYLKYDLQTQYLSYANAGHPPPLLLRKDALYCEHLDADGLILGVSEQINFEEKKVLLATGDLLLIYTDGLIEAENAKGELFGLSRLARSFTRYADATPEQIMAGLLAELKQFCHPKAFQDDLSLMVFKQL